MTYTITETGMSNDDEWNNDDSLIEYLSVQLINGKLGLVLGSGASCGFGLPQWDKLISRLYSNTGKPAPDLDGKTSEDLAEYYIDEHLNGDKARLIKELNKALYGGIKIDFPSLRENDLLASIASLVMSSYRGKTSNVITFNFDDLLETYLLYHGFVTESVYQTNHWESYADVTIYHPHGFIPYDLQKEHSRGEDIILDQKSYSDAIGKDSNPERQLMLTIMRQRTCLFVGLSGKDGNLDSFLTACQKYHAINNENTKYWGITFMDTDDPVMENKWKKRGIFYKNIQDYDLLPDFLFKICQKAAEIRKND